jgi:hypothetical protein
VVRLPGSSLTFSETGANVLQSWRIKSCCHGDTRRTLAREASSRMLQTAPGSQRLQQRVQLSFEANDCFRHHSMVNRVWDLEPTTWISREIRTTDMRHAQNFHAIKPHTTQGPWQTCKGSLLAGRSCSPTSLPCHRSGWNRMLSRVDRDDPPGINLRFFSPLRSRSQPKGAHGKVVVYVCQSTVRLNCRILRWS